MKGLASLTRASSRVSPRPCSDTRSFMFRSRPADIPRRRLAHKYPSFRATLKTCRTSCRGVLNRLGDSFGSHFLLDSFQVERADLN